MCDPLWKSIAMMCDEELVRWAAQLGYTPKPRTRHFDFSGFVFTPAETMANFRLRVIDGVISRG